VKERIVASLEAQKGFAMVLTLLITVIMTLLGVSFLLMAETENRIAENERLSSQAMFFAEAGTRLVESWLNSVYLGDSLILPSASIVDRTQRLIDDDGDPSTLPHPQDGSINWPRYKQNVDLDLDSADDIFHRPYRGDSYHSFLGTADGPDIRIDETASTAARDFLIDLSERLIPDFPGGAIQARISKIDVYGPPYINLGGAWTRYGLGTVAVEASLYKPDGAGGEHLLARRTVTAVMNEVPYYLPRGPLQAGGPVTFDGELSVHWGPVVAAGISELDAGFNGVARSLPREIPAGVNVDLLWAYNDNTKFAAYKTAAEGLGLGDPWLRYFSAGPITNAPNQDVQISVFSWDPADPVNNPLADVTSDSNLYQRMTATPFSRFDYDFWKRLAQSRHSRVHYYVWVEGSSFSENGYGPEKTFREITDGQEGIFFFDTRDGEAPRDDNGDGPFDNLTPEIVINGGTWSVKGVIFLNAERFQVSAANGRQVIFNPPGEPFQDKNADGKWDTGENWINLLYPASLADPFVADAADTVQDDGTAGVAPMWNRIGPDIPGLASLWGVLYTTGTYDASGTAVHYGSIIAEGGVVQSAGGTSNSSIYWDDRIPSDWPPRDWNLPRVFASNWDSE
jgi:hypothetical protein